jgi:hypothetical protein
MFPGLGDDSKDVLTCGARFIASEMFVLPLGFTHVPGSLRHCVSAATVGSTLCCVCVQSLAALQPFTPDHVQGADHFAVLFVARIAAHSWTPGLGTTLLMRHCARLHSAQTQTCKLVCTGHLQRNPRIYNAADTPYCKLAAKLQAQLDHYLASHLVVYQAPPLGTLVAPEGVTAPPQLPTYVCSAAAAGDAAAADAPATAPPEAARAGAGGEAQDAGAPKHEEHTHGADSGAGGGTAAMDIG